LLILFVGFFNKDLSKQILSQISEGMTPGQIKTQSEETRKVLRHGSAVRKQEVQNQETALKRHATEHTGALDKQSHHPHNLSEDNPPQK
jgi:hypothetical protein